MLCGNNYLVDSYGFIVIVFYRYLSLAVRTEIRKGSVLADLVSGKILQMGDGDGSLLDDGVGHLNGGVQQFFLLHDLHDQAALLGLVSGEHTTGQNNFLGDAQAHDAGQTLSAAEAGQDAQVALGLAELGVGSGDTDIAAHGQLAAAAQSEAVDSSDGDLRHLLQTIEGVLGQQSHSAALSGSGVDHLGDVSTGNECLGTGTGDDDNTDVFTDLLPYAVSTAEDGTETVITLAEVLIPVVETTLVQRKTYIKDFSEYFDMEETITPPLEAIRAATVMFSTVPILCVYPFLQKYFAKGVMIGAVKG